MKIYIQKYCQIKELSCKINGETIYSSPDASFNNVEFLSALYREMKTAYPKYFKMDGLSRLGFLTADILLKNTAFANDVPKENMGMFISNNASSLDTDINYQKTIGEDYFPSPAVFVYTLPNILMGEIAIRYKILGENTFFVSESFDTKTIFQYVYQSFQQSGLDSAIIGWVDFLQDTCESFLFLLTNKETEGQLNTEFTEESIQIIYKS